MEADGKRKLETGKEYDKYFPPADYKETLIIRGKARLEDTMKLIRAVLVKDRQDTVKIAKVLKGATPKESARKAWDFVYKHIQYIPDREGTEEIRRPTRLWADRQHGGDCDCMSVFIGTILENQQLPYTLRIAEYDKGYYQHIYPIVITDPRFYTETKGRENRDYYIVADCVKNNFDDEHPYRKIKDFDIKKMDLAYLSGLGNTNDRFEGQEATTDTLDKMEGLGMSSDYYVDGLGKIRRRRTKGTVVATTVPAVIPKPEVKRFLVKRSNIYKLANGIQVKMGRYVRAAGERIVLFKSPGQPNYTESGILHENSFFADNNDTVWGRAAINNTWWKKPINAGWTRTNEYEYNRAQQNRKPPVYLNGYILKDGAKIFLDKRAPQTPNGYPVRWKRPDEEDGWIANGSLTALYLSENTEYVIGRNGQGHYYKSTGFATWQELSENDYLEQRKTSLKGLNDVDSMFTLNGDDELTLNAPSETKGLYIPYEDLQRLFSKRIDPQRSYNGIGGIGYLLGDNVLNTIEPLLEGDDELNGDDEKTGMFGEVEILGTEGYYENIGDLVALTGELTGEESLLVADGLGRVKRSRARRKGKGGGISADSQATPSTGKTLKKLGLYIPAQTLNQLLKWRNEHLIRLQNKGKEVSRGEVPATLDGFFDILKAPLKAVLSVAKFVPIPGVSAAANLLDKATGSNSVPPSKPVDPAVQAAIQRQQQMNTEMAAAYDQEMQGIGGWGTQIYNTIKDNPVKTLLIAGSVGVAGYLLLKKGGNPLSGTETTPKRKRKKRHTRASVVRH